MIQHLLYAYEMNLKRAVQIVDDIAEEQMAVQPSGLVNHPAWTLGHLASTSNSLAGMHGLPSTFPEAWRDSFQMGGIPSGDRADYPSKAELVAQLRAQHDRVAQAVAAAGAEQLGRPTSNPRLRERFPTVGDFTAALLTNHEANHIGQLATWRRAMGLGPA